MSLLPHIEDQIRAAHAPDWDDDRPTRAEAEADAALDRAHPDPQPCPGCATLLRDCTYPGCCDTCQDAARGGEQVRHWDEAWRAAIVGRVA